MSLFILSVLLTQGSSSPILSKLQEAYLDHWNKELDPLEQNVLWRGWPYSHKWLQSYLDEWTLELNPAHQTFTLNEQNQDHIKDEIIEGNIKDSSHHNEDIEEIDEDSTESDSDSEDSTESAIYK